MSQTPGQTNVQFEKIANAFVARVRVKLLDEPELNLLSRLIDESLSDQNVTVIVIDLEGVQLLPSLGLGKLVEFTNKCKAKENRMKLAGLSPNLRRVLTLTRLDRLLELSDSVETAIQ